MQNHEIRLTKNIAVIRVKERLQAAGLTFEILQFAQSTRTAEEAAAAIGCNVAQIVKSLLFQTVISQQPILLLVSGKNRVDEKKVAALLGEKIAKADADFARAVTGFAIGGIPPLQNEQIYATYIDQDLLEFDVLWAAAGTPFAVFRLLSCDIPKLIQGKVVSISQ